MAVCIKPGQLKLANVFRSGEPEKLAMRYRKFSLPALLDECIKATGNDGSICKYHIQLTHSQADP